MPNGYHGNKKEWVRIESPMRRLDKALKEFAATWGMTVRQNDHNWPDRSLTWSDEMERKIQLFLEGERALTYTLSAVAWQDRPDGRYWKHETVAKAAPISAIEPDLLLLLDRARVVASSWSPADLRHVNP